MRKPTVFISFFTSCTQPCPSDLSAHTHPVCDVCVCDVCVCALWLTLHSHGASASALDGGRALECDQFGRMCDLISQWCDQPFEGKKKYPRL